MPPFGNSAGSSAIAARHVAYDGAMSRRRVSPRTPRGTPTQRSERIEPRTDGDWYVRPITGSSSTKPYRCPGCDHLIALATPHTVVWPVVKALLSDAAIDERRHWHTACWTRRR